MSDSSESVRIADSFASWEGGVRTEAGKSSDKVLTAVVPFYRSVGDCDSAAMAEADEENGFAVFSVNPDAVKSFSFPEEAALPSTGVNDLTMGNDGLGGLRRRFFTAKLKVVGETDL